jgi:hypothetical protein
LAALRKLGVLAWRLDADNHETDPRLAAIRKVRGYSYTVRAGRSQQQQQRCVQDCHSSSSSNGSGSHRSSGDGAR